MAFNNTLVLEVQTGGNDTNNGGGFDPNASFATDLTATSANTSSPVVSSASYTFVSGDIGAWLYIKSGTNWTPGYYQIASVSSGLATLSASIGVAYGFNGYSNTGFNTVVGCATTASPTSGTWGVDYSQQTSSQFSFTDLVIGSTTTQFTSAAHPVGPNFVGNLIAITSGTGFTVQRVQINSVSGTTATCDKSLGTASSTGGNGGLGGCLASIGQAAQIFNLTAANAYQVYVKYGTYSLSTSTNVSGGCINLGFGIYAIGYDTSRFQNNLDTNRPTLQCGANSITIFNFTGGGGYIGINNFILNSNSKTNTTGISSNSTMLIMRTDTIGFDQYGFQLQGGGTYVINCTGSSYNGSNGCFRSANASVIFVNCTVIGTSAGDGFNDTTGSGSMAFNCVAKGCSGKGFYGFKLYVNCTSYGNGSSGFEAIGGNIFIAINCVAYGNGSYGYRITSVSTQNYTFSKLINCAGGNNTTANYSTGSAAIFQNIQNFIILTANPFTAPTGTPPDFTINSTAGGGALLAAASFPTLYPGLTGTNARDVGAIQTGSGGSGGGASYYAF